MRATLVSLLILLALAVQPTPAQAATTQPVSWHPCARIRAACNQAGFVRNGAKRGLGIMLDCIRPIMTEMPQRTQATKALPQIDPLVVAACKERNPNFGKGGRAKSQPSVQPTTKPPSTLRSESAADRGQHRQAAGFTKSRLRAHPVKGTNPRLGRFR